MGTEYIVASRSGRTYYELWKGPWASVDWSLSGHALRESLLAAMAVGLHEWTQRERDQVADAIVAGVDALPSDRALFSEHDEDVWQDAIETRPDLRAFDRNPPLPYTKTGSRFYP